MNYHNEMGEFSFTVGPIAATNAIDSIFWTANRDYKLVGIKSNFAGASTSGTVMIEKSPGTLVAPASGVDLLTTDILASGGLLSVVDASLTTSEKDLLIGKGDSLMMDWSGTVTNLLGMYIQITLECR